MAVSVTTLCCSSTASKHERQIMLFRVRLAIAKELHDQAVQTLVDYLKAPERTTSFFRVGL